MLKTNAGGASMRERDVRDKKKRAAAEKKYTSVAFKFTATNTAFDAASAKPPMASGKLLGLIPPSVSSHRTHRDVGNPGNFTKAGTLVEKLPD
jgi:hypothetical protein